MKLSYGQRKAMPKKDFALPGKREGGKGGYPIEDKAHARNALARVAQHGSSAEKAEVREKVHKKYPSIGKNHDSGHDSDDRLEKREHHESAGRIPDHHHPEHAPGVPHEHLNPTAAHFDKLGR